MSGKESKTPLYSSLDTIRLLQLPWNSGPTKSQGRLVSFALDSCPEFIALSYTWGNSLHRTPINVNGHEIQVLSNLHTFLKLVPSLPDFSPKTWWWIDSICMNQKDEVEKSAQMKIMGKIYSQAYETIVWLGSEIEDTPETPGDCKNAVRDLHRLSDSLSSEGNQEKKQSKKLQKLREEDSGLDWKSLKCLLMRPWWRRVWTLQEFLISNHVRFFCGAKSISRRKMMKAIYAAWICKAWDQHLLDKSAFYAGWNRRRMNQWFSKREGEIGLVAMMAYVGDSGATDERDRVYSLLGIARDRDLVRIVDPEFTVEDVFRQLVGSFFDKYGCLDIICYSHVFKNSAELSELREKKRLPSWIPDWKVHVEGKVMPVMASQGSNPGTGNFRPVWALDTDLMYRASKGRDPTYQISNDGQILTCSGIVLDIIDGLGGSKYNDTGELERNLPLIQPTSSKNANPLLSDPSISDPTNEVEIILRSLVRCLTLDRADRYLSEHLPETHYLEALKSLCEAYFHDPNQKDIPRYFRSWIETNEELLILGRPLKSYCNEAISVFHSLKTESTEKLGGRVKDTISTMARRLAITEKGRLGMAPSRAQKGDSVMVLYGCNIPVLLRDRGGKFEFVGECYVDGFMDGEAITLLNDENGFREGNFCIV